MILIALFVLVYVVLGVVAWRRPLLARLAVREAIRRPWQSVLVVAGLTVGTSMILMSSIMGDSTTATLTQATYQDWGRVDILVSANGQFFNPNIAAGLANSPRLHGKVRGVQAGVELVGVAADLQRRLDNPTVRLIGFDPTTQSAFGSFTLTDGRTTNGEDLAPNEVLVSKSLADSLQAKRGDTVRVATSGSAPVEFTVYGIARPVGPGNYGGQPAIFLTLSALKTLTASDQINVVRLSSIGEGQQELENSKHIAPAVAASLLEIPSDFPLRVRTAKADDVNEIVRLAADNVPINFALSSVVILAGIALVVNLAIALAEERRPHLAVLRALGLGRAGLVIIALIEGAIYSAGAALIGAVPGIAFGWLMASNTGRWIPEIHEKNATVLVVVSIQAIAVSIAAGALVTLATLFVASVRTTRLSIATAVRSLPDLPVAKKSRRRPNWVIVALATAGFVMAAVGGSPLRQLGGIAVIAAAGLLLTGRLPDRARATLVGGAAVAWLFGTYATMSFSVVASNLWITVVFLSLSTISLALVLAVNIRVVERFIPRPLVAPLTRRTPRLVLAASALALVLSFLTFDGVFLASTQPDYRKDTGGYDVTVSSMSTESVSLPPALEAKVDKQLAISTATYFGPVRSSLSDRGPGGVDWHQQLLTLYVLSGDQLDHVALPLASRDTRFRTDSDVWTAVRNDPSLVVSGLHPPGASVDLIGANGPVQVTVAARFKPGFLEGLMGSARGLGPLASTPAGTTLLLRLKADVDPATFALDVRRSMFPAGVEATTTRDLLVQGDSIIRNYIAALGLLLMTGLGVGVLSLGVLALRAVVERRRSIGLLRALGYQPRQLLMAMIGESLLTAMVGAVVGITVGLFVGYVVMAGYYPGGEVRVQLDFLSAAVALIFVTAVAVTVAPAVAVARIAPAQALRLVD
jgi:putative ABC transport system permease protein